MVVSRPQSKFSRTCKAYHARYALPVNITVTDFNSSVVKKGRIIAYKIDDRQDMTLSLILDVSQLTYFAFYAIG